MQFNRGFTFEQAVPLIDYLYELGIALATHRHWRWRDQAARTDKTSPTNYTLSLMRRFSAAPVRVKNCCRQHN
jgi:hypothetical protein